MEERVHESLAASEDEEKDPLAERMPEIAATIAPFRLDEGDDSNVESDIIIEVQPDVDSNAEEESDDEEVALDHIWLPLHPV